MPRRRRWAETGCLRDLRSFFVYGEEDVTLSKEEVTRVKKKLLTAGSIRPWWQLENLEDLSGSIFAVPFLPGYLLEYSCILQLVDRSIGRWTRYVE